MEQNPTILQKIKERFSGLPWYLWLFIIITLIACVLIIFYFLNAGFKKYVKQSLNQDPNIWTPPETQASEVLGGTQSYQISGGTEGLPQITQLIVSPQDAAKGVTQTVAVAVNNISPIKDVIIVLHLDDNKDFEYHLKMVKGVDTNGVWQTSYAFPGTYNNTYRITVKARNENNLGNMSTISIR